MLFAKKENRSDFRVYLAMLNRVLDKNQVENSVFTTILSNACDISQGSMNLYEVDQSIYPIVVYIVKNFSDDLETINTQNLQKENYESLQGYMKKALNLT